MDMARRRLMTMAGALAPLMATLNEAVKADVLKPGPSFGTWRTPLELLFGGFEGARIVHFLGMAGIAGFIVVHVALVVLVPKTLIAMVLGKAQS